MINIERDIAQTIKKWLFKGKVISIYGARQVGKTTLAKSLLNEFDAKMHYYDCELLKVKNILLKRDPLELGKFFGDAKIIVLDEAQTIPDIGLILKTMHDHIPHLQIIATGSSSFDLASKTGEPLTGRGLEFKLYPISLNEMLQVYNKADLNSLIDDFLIYGMYPEIIAADYESKKILLDDIAGKYLFKDIFAFESLRNSDVILKLLQLLALQISSEVSLHEIANILGISRATVERYLDLLEKSFVIFRLSALSRNMRNEIGKKQKWYFYDLGIRNALLSRYQPLELRDDKGALWENFCIIERMKYRQNNAVLGQTYFWRTLDRKEIDYIEDYNGVLHGYEFKFSPNAKFKKPNEFLSAYSGSEIEVVHSGNIFDFVGI